MNRVGLGLAVGAGYLLGRTKKAKLALAVGSMVAGKKMNLGPRQLTDLVNQQLKNNPQFKEIGDQLRQDLQGVGKAASGAMVERQMTALADRLHGRTSKVRDQLAGVVPETGGDGGKKEAEGEYEDEYEDREGREAGGEPESAGESEEEPEDEPARKEAAKKAPAKKAAKTASAGAPAKKATKKAPAKKAVAKKTAAGKKAAAKKTAAAGNATRAVRSRLPKGGGDR
ncbi:DNA primase [Streptomyces sp. NTH33]|uniref:DNA primase n=1 Tax=Streptomyces sp. NTH33 TaxID=1735453 RepID=UPI000DA8ADFD|nr:DNA primase [Streptomyces sp. NTH33]PZH02199.1 DNA primase [Streptomyces sp. NTH33]